MKNPTRNISNRQLMRKGIPKVVIIGTEHGSEGEREVFQYLNQTASGDMHWLCEGESDFRRCCSLKDYSVHLVTDSLFIYMIINDWGWGNLGHGVPYSPIAPSSKWGRKKALGTIQIHELDREKTVSPIAEGEWVKGEEGAMGEPRFPHLKQELIDRLIEFLITVCRLPSSYLVLQNKIKGLLVNYSDSFDRCLSLLNQRPLTQSQLKIAEEIILKGGIISDMTALKGLFKKIVNILLRSRLVQPHGYHYENKIRQFLVNPKGCLDCEEMLFTKLREKSFLQTIISSLQQYRNLPEITVITVGNDHVEPLSETILNRFPLYEIITFGFEDDLETIRQHAF